MAEQPFRSNFILEKIPPVLKSLGFRILNSLWNWSSRGEYRIMTPELTAVSSSRTLFEFSCAIEKWKQKYHGKELQNPVLLTYEYAKLLEVFKESMAFRSLYEDRAKRYSLYKNLRDNFYLMTDLPFSESEAIKCCIARVISFVNWVIYEARNCAHSRLPVV